MGRGKGEGMQWEPENQGKSVPGRQAEEHQKADPRLEKVFGRREMCKGSLGRWLQTPSLDVPVTHSGKPTALTVV